MVPVDVHNALGAESSARRWVQDLPNILAEKGFVETRRSSHPAEPEWFQLWTHNQLTVAEEISWQNPDQEAGQRSRENLKGSYAESYHASTGAVTKQSPSVTIGLLPL